MLLGAIGFVTIASFSITVVLGQAYLPNRIGLASGVTLGLAIGLGGVAATALGVVADHAGLHAVLWVDRAAARSRRSCSRSACPRYRRRAVVADGRVRPVEAGNQ